MPFLKLNNSWSNLAQYYNQSFNNKPEVPKLKYTDFDDGLIRGGLINAGLATVRDVSRIGKFLLTGRGVSFITKQVGLQLSNPKLETKKLNTNGTGVAGTISNIANSVTNAIGPNRIYNLGINTLASTAGTAFGLHFDRAGILPILNDDQKYGGNIYTTSLGVAWKNNFDISNIESNRKINKDSANRLLKYADISFRLSTEGSITLTDYFGGAQSVYGLFPKTVIRTTSERSSDGIKRFTDSETYNKKGFNPLTNKEISGLQQAKLYDNLESQLNTNGDVLPSGSFIHYNSVIAGYNIEKRIGVSTKKNLDSINTINIIDSKTFYDISDGPDGTVSNEVGKAYNNEYNIFNNKKDVSGKFANDLIKFRIEFLNNEQPTSNSSINTDVLAFRAYINDFNDGMNAKWDSYRYMGRGEEFYIYNGFTRDISLNFTIHAHNEDEMAPLYSKLNYLMSAFTPDYSSQLKMRGNIGYLTVGDYLYRQPGVFTDIKIDGLLEGSWDIGLGEDGKSNGQYELPRMLKVGLSFKPIHSFLPRRNYGKPIENIQKFPAPFITPDRRSYPAGGTNTNNRYLNTGGWASTS